MGFEYPMESDMHNIGDPKCDGCWKVWPRECECGGLVHAEFGEQLTYDSYSLVIQCDKCGNDYICEEE